MAAYTLVPHLAEVHEWASNHGHTGACDANGALNSAPECDGAVLICWVLAITPRDEVLEANRAAYRDEKPDQERQGGNDLSFRGRCLEPQEPPDRQEEDDDVEHHI